MSRHFHMLNGRTFEFSRKLARFNAPSDFWDRMRVQATLTVTVGLTRKIRAYGNGVQSGNHYGEIAEIYLRIGRRAW